MSAKTTAEKLRIRPGTTLWSSHPDRLATIGPLPTGVRLVESPAQATTALLFVDDAATARDRVAALEAELRAADVLWVAYPKGNRADINRDTLWPIIAEHGLRPVAQVSLDDVWSSLRFRPLRDGEAPFTGGR